jgi:hypothetical protein
MRVCSQPHDADAIREFGAERKFLSVMPEDERPPGQPFQAIDNRPFHQSKPDKLWTKIPQGQPDNACGCAFRE